VGLTTAEVNFSPISRRQGPALWAGMAGRRHRPIADAAKGREQKNRMLRHTDYGMEQGQVL